MPDQVGHDTGIRLLLFFLFSVSFLRKRESRQRGLYPNRCPIRSGMTQGYDYYCFFYFLCHSCESENLVKGGSALKMPDQVGHDREVKVGHDRKYRL